MHEQFLNGRVTVKTGDITVEDVDAIVNAANSTLLGGGGVDGAIHDAGGPRILGECKFIREKYYPDGLPTGKVVITTAGDMPARHVIHTVGPVYGTHAGHESELLADCYTNAIALAVENDLSSIAFPAISTGAYRFPKPQAAAIASAAIAGSLAQFSSIRDVKLVFFSDAEAMTFVQNCRF